METKEAKDLVTEVTVSASKKKQISDYEPAEAYTEYTAEVPKGEDPEEVREALNDLAWEATESAVMERWEAHVRKQMDDE